MHAPHLASFSAVELQRVDERAVVIRLKVTLRAHIEKFEAVLGRRRVEVPAAMQERRWHDGVATLPDKDHNSPKPGLSEQC